MIFGEIFSVPFVRWPGFNLVEWMVDHSVTVQNVALTTIVNTIHVLFAALQI